MTRPWRHEGLDTAQRSRRLRREARTVDLMIRMYCRAHHDATEGTGTIGGIAGCVAAGAAPCLCPQCTLLAEYSRQRIGECRFGADKPTCAHCAVHCFRPQMREQIRTVMRYSGPRMTLRHPILALAHLLDGRRIPI